MPPPMPRALKKSNPFSAARRKPTKFPTKPTRLTGNGSVYSAALPTRWTFCPLTGQATAVCAGHGASELAEIHILENEPEARAYLIQVWAEAMEIYRSGKFKLRFSPAMNEYLKIHQREFMPEDTKAEQIIEYLEKCSDSMVCSKQLYREALGHEYDEPKQWEIREINDIMNNSVTGWKAFSNPRYFRSPYGRQKGWERISLTTGTVVFRN